MLSKSRRRCIAIAGYWRNDQSDGLNITIEDHESGGGLDEMLELLDRVVLTHAEASPSLSQMLDCLKHQATQKSDDPVEKIFTLGMIAYMEESGILESDEYNGMLYIYHDDHGIEILGLGRLQ